MVCCWMGKPSPEGVVPHVNTGLSANIAVRAILRTYTKFLQKSNVYDKGRLKIFHPNLTHFESNKVTTLNMDLGNGYLNQGVREYTLSSCEALGDVDRA